MNELQKSPFKLLDPYNSEDHEIFFGRKTDEVILYQLVKKNRLVLVYGPSGSGKTSLLQCGLTRQFDKHEWIPVFIRRGDNLITSLLDELKRKLAIAPDKKQSEKEQIINGLIDYRREDMRPIYLLFDQFEELLILGTEAEQKLFSEILAEFMSGYSRLFCNVVISMREEYFASLDSFEEGIAGISSHRIRVEPLRAEGTREVIIKSCKAFNIQLEDECKTSDQIIEVLSDSKAMQLPYLQVYLDQLWKKVSRQDAPEKDSDEVKSTQVRFSEGDIKKLGKIKDVFRGFLFEQQQEIQQRVKEAFPDAPDDFVQNVLDAFVSSEGTKLPVSYHPSGNLFEFVKKKSPPFLQQADKKMLTLTIQMLVDSRILRNDSSSVEIAHDSLAKLIYKRRSIQKQSIVDLRKQIVEDHARFKERNEYPSYKQIKTYEVSLAELHLDKELMNFFKKAKAYCEDIELERLKSVRRLNRTKLMMYISFVFLAIIFFIFFLLKDKADADYAQVYMAYTLDTVSDKKDAIILAKYINEYKSFDDEVRKKLERSTIKTGLSQAVQSMQARFSFELPTTQGLANGDIDISPGGDFVIVRCDSARQGSTNKFLLLDRQGRIRRQFNNTAYAYFLSSSDTVVLVGNLFPKNDVNRVYPSDSFQLRLYDCPNDTVIFRMDLGRDYQLYEAGMALWDGGKWNNSRRVRYSASGKLVIPYEPVDDNNGWTNGKLMFSGTGLRDINSSLSTASTPDGRFFAATDYSSTRNPKVTIYDQDGNRVSSTRGQYADFTRDGTLLLVDDNRLLFSKNTKIIDSMPLTRRLYWVLAGNDATYALAVAEEDSTLLFNFSKKLVHAYHEQILGFDFDRHWLITRPLSANAKKDTLLYRRHLVTGKVDSIIIKEGIQDARYCVATGDLLVLTPKDDLTDYNLLCLFDDRLNKKAVLGLTPNDVFGISRDGSAIYYVRDNYLSVFDNNGKLVDLSSYPALSEWIRNERAFNLTSEKMREKKRQYHLDFSLRSIFK